MAEPRNAREKAQLAYLLEAVPSMELDNAAADAACEIRRELERNGSAGSEWLTL